MKVEIHVDVIYPSISRFLTTHAMFSTHTFEQQSFSTLQSNPMKKQELWLNLPVKDLQKSKTFFESLGFQTTREAPGMLGFTIGQVPVMMVAEPDFEKFTLFQVSDTKKGSELLISVDAPDRTYVDDMAKKVKAAGGEVFAEAANVQGWMYGMGFADLDGHRWNIIYMDWENMPKP